VAAEDAVIKGTFWYVVSIAILHALGVALLLPLARANPALLGMGFLAYTLGLRHAFDADHIAAIDNTVRKLAQQHRNPLGVGFFFSLGHSTVVFVMAIGIAVFARWAAALPHLREIGGIVGATVSGSFLLLIGAMNLVLWLDIFRAFRRLRQGEYDEQAVDRLMQSGGLVSRFAAPLYRFIRDSWHVYPLGFVFGLGFDTASEIALLALSAAVAATALPLSAIIALPLLFAAGMTLMDSADGFFMTTAYRWAFSTPARKLYYNLTVTGISVVAALLIGSTELAQVAARAINASSAGWGGWLQQLDFGQVGYALVALFAATWLLAYGTWRLLRWERG